MNITMRMAVVYGAHWERLYAQGLKPFEAHRQAWAVMKMQEAAEAHIPVEGESKVRPLTDNDDLFTLPPVVKM
jgi:hypothetical protein